MSATSVNSENHISEMEELLEERICFFLFFFLDECLSSAGFVRLASELAGDYSYAQLLLIVLDRSLLGCFGRMLLLREGSWVLEAKIKPVPIVCVSLRRLIADHTA